MPVYDFLVVPRTWPALNAWCREKRFGAAKLRHCLAWLESEGLARTYDSDEILWGRVSLSDVGHDA